MEQTFVSWRVGPCRVLAVLAALTLGPAGPVPVEAHATRSVSIEVSEVRAGHGLLQVRAQLPDDRVAVRVASPCRRTPAGETAAPRDGLVQVSRLECPDRLAGAVLTIDGLGPIVSEAIVMYAFADGRTGSHVVRADAPVWVLPAAERRRDVALSYTWSGVVHILEGYDHLLFLLLLVLHLRRVRAVVLAETAFTVSHSVSFSATALGLVHVSAPAAEACIALSLVLMALDIRCGEPGPSGRGAGMAFVFGLVHGLGFAGALSEVGLPDREVATALIGFAGGVELGQLAFLAVVLAAVAWAERAGPQMVRRWEPAGVALMGGLSTYWLFDRVWSVVLLRG